LIIGGSRFIGAWLTRRLVRAGHTVMLLNRGESQPPFPLDAARMTGDVDQLDAHIGAIRAAAPEVVVHMLVTGAQRAWDLARLLAGSPARAVFISSADVYRSYDFLTERDTGESIHDPLHEDAPLRRRLYPYRSEPPADAASWRQADYDKIPAELIFREAFGARGTILRLPFVYGPGDFQHRLYDTVRRIDDGRRAILIDDQLAGWRCSRGYVENVAEAISLSVESPAAGGRIYNVGDARPLSSAAWIRTIGAQLQWPGEVVVLPRAALPESLRPEGDFSHPLVLETSRIRRELGYREACSVADAIDRTAAWERESPPEAAAWPDPFDYAAEDAALSVSRAAPE
jgi:nucleoside-diphosphate-sugar epimerase